MRTATGPDVVYAAPDGSYYDATAVGWDARTLAPLVPRGPAMKPVQHEPACTLAAWPDLAPYCPCTFLRP